MPDSDWDTPIKKYVPHTIRCKCGAVIASGLQLHTGGFIFPTSVTEFQLCEVCQDKQDASEK